MCSPDAQQKLLRRRHSTEGNGPAHSGPSLENATRWSPGNIDRSVEARPENLKVPRDAALHFSKYESFGVSQECLGPGPTEAVPQLPPPEPLHREIGHNSWEPSAPSSPLSTPGSDGSTFQDGPSSKASTLSTDPSECGESEDTLPKGRPSPLGMVPNALTTDLIICLFLGWLCIQVVPLLLSQVEHARTCPGGSDSGTTSRAGSHYSVAGYPFPQHTNGSIRRERDDGRGDEDDDQSRWPERRGQMPEDSSPTTPQRLACPFHKYDPKRYSAFNETETEYRICSSGHWPNISQLK